MAYTEDLFAWPLVYNRAKLQWRTQRRKLCFFSIDDRLRITISTVWKKITLFYSLFKNHGIRMKFRDKSCVLQLHIFHGGRYYSYNTNVHLC